MTLINRSGLKGLWVTGYKPTQADYADLFDTFFNLVDDGFAVEGQVDFTTAEPGSPAAGQRYINTVTGTSSGTSTSVTQYYIYSYDGSAWVEIPAAAGKIAFDKGSGQFLVFNGSAWSQVSGGSSSSAYMTTFNATTDWTLNGSVYELTVPQATHGKLATDPITVVAQEDNGTEWVTVNLNDSRVNKTTGDVTISVSASPDARFAGRVIIS